MCWEGDEEQEGDTLRFRDSLALVQGELDRQPRALQLCTANL